jgi:hypothetical protein
LIIYVVDLTIIKQVLEIYAYYTMKCGKPVVYNRLSSKTGFFYTLVNFNAFQEALLPLNVIKTRETEPLGRHSLAGFQGTR